jgi:hypothetical protein
MAALLKIVDEHFGPGGTDRLPAVDLRLVSERVTPREIIRRRVEAEVEVLNQRKIAYAAGHARTRSFLIDIDAASPEAVLNLPLKSKRGGHLARVEEETGRALAAFGRQHFIMLFDDRQIDDLDLEVTVTPESKVVFLYLTPLKGG